MEKMEQAAQPETWFDGNKVNDVLFCEDFLAGHPMKCIHGTFFDINGAIGDAEQIKAEIYYKIALYVTTNIAKKATTLLDALRIRCYSPPLPFQTDRIHVANGPDGCTPHRIKEQDLYDIVLKDIREWAAMALADEQAVLDRVMEQQQLKSTVDYGLTLRKIDIFDYDSIHNEFLLEDIKKYGKQIY